jgi:hypothetical protein
MQIRERVLFEMFSLNFPTGQENHENIPEMCRSEPGLEHRNFRIWNSGAVHSPCLRFERSDKMVDAVKNIRT